jgi:hypothetical protein
MFGYEESMAKMEEIGRTEINKHGMFVKFYCTPEKLFEIKAEMWYGDFYLTTITYPYFSLFRIGLSTHTTN